MMVFRWRRRA